MLLALLYGTVETFYFNNDTIEIKAWDVTESIQCTNLATKHVSLRLLSDLRLLIITMKKL